MSGYDATTYGDRIADVYDQWYASADPSMIDLLAELAGAGPGTAPRADGEQRQARCAVAAAAPSTA